MKTNSWAAIVTAAQTNQICTMTADHIAAVIIAADAEFQRLYAVELKLKRPGNGRPAMPTDQIKPASVKRREQRAKRKG